MCEVGEGAGRVTESLREVTALAVRLGFTAFGGPAAHIAMLRHEVVTRRGWIADRDYADLIGATNLIPGPNSTEMVMHVGHLRAGRRGMIAAGIGFILPAASMVLLLAWLYVRFGTEPALEGVLAGIKPVIIAIVLQAIVALARTTMRTPMAVALGVAVFAGYLAGLNELALLFGGGAVMLAVRAVRARLRVPAAVFAPWAIVPVLAGSPRPAAPLWDLFLTFLRIGAVLYGSGYVLIAFLRNEVVDRHGWLTAEELLDAVAIGQFTPGPVFTTATFVGYVAAGFPGAVLATIGIFLPAFVFVAILHPLVPRIRANPWTAAALDGLNVAAIALMAAVSLDLGRDALVDWRTWLIGLVALGVLLRWPVNSAWLVLAGGIIGWVVL
jgi:chromate transporter